MKKISKKQKTQSVPTVAAVPGDLNLRYIEDFLVWAKAREFPVTRVKFQDAEVELAPPKHPPAGTNALISREVPIIPISEEAEEMVSSMMERASKGR